MHIKPILKTIAAASLSFGLFGCGVTESTDNSKTAGTTVRGTAAKGYALSLADVEVEDADGNVIGTGSTDSSGQFVINLDTEEIDFPLLVEVDASEDGTLTAIIADDDEESDGDYFTLVNPLTDLAVRELLGAALEGDLEEIEDAEWIAMAEEIIESLLGEGVDYEEFFIDEDFDPAEEGDLEDEADLADMILHTLYEEYEENSEYESLYEMLDMLEEAEAMVLDNDAEFQAELFANLEEFQILAEELEADMADLIDENEALRAELEALEEELEAIESGEDDEEGEDDATCEEDEGVETCVFEEEGEIITETTECTPLEDGTESCTTNVYIADELVETETYIDVDETDAEEATASTEAPVEGAV